MKTSGPDAAAATTPAPDADDVVAASNATGSGSVPTGAELARTKTAAKTGTPAAAAAKSGSPSG
nr:hypothetical protein GCM10020092_095190 [Actinoplanes digitatis]